jgi:hypothetical protein
MAEVAELANNVSSGFWLIQKHLSTSKGAFFTLAVTFFWPKRNKFKK